MTITSFDLHELFGIPEALNEDESELFGFAAAIREVVTSCTEVHWSAGSCIHAPCDLSWKPFSFLSDAMRSAKRRRWRC